MKVMGHYRIPERQLRVWKSVERDLSMSKLILASFILEIRSNMQFSFPSLFLPKFFCWVKTDLVGDETTLDSITTTKYKCQKL